MFESAINPSDLVTYVVVTVVVYYAVSIYVCVSVLEFCGVTGIERLKRKYPPISDQEFVKRCRPGTNPRVALRVRQIVADTLGVPVEIIHPDMKFTEFA